MLIDKVKNPGLNDESRLIFNYRNVYKDMPECALVFTSKIYNYLSDSRYKYFQSADIKYRYFAIRTYLADKYVFTFYIDGIGQL